MDLKFVSSLIAVVDLGSLAAAARAEGITASAVTQRVAALEAELQVSLLLRAGRVMQPTPQCRAVLPLLRQILALRTDVRVKLRQRNMTGPLRLGAISTALADYAPNLVRVLRLQAPEVELKLVPGTSRELYAAFEADKLDAALLVRPPFDWPKTLVFTPIEHQNILLIQPAGAQDVSDLPFIVYSRDAWGGAACWTALTNLEPMPKILAEMDAVETIAQMVQDGLGQAVLPEWSGGAQRMPKVITAALDAPARDVGLVTRTRDKDRPVLQLLLTTLQKT